MSLHEEYDDIDIGSQLCVAVATDNVHLLDKVLREQPAIDNVHTKTLYLYLSIASSLGKEAVVEAMLRHVPPTEAALCAACREGHVGVVKMLMSAPGGRSIVAGSKAVASAAATCRSNGARSMIQSILLTASDRDETK